MRTGTCCQREEEVPVHAIRRLVLLSNADTQAVHRQLEATLAATAAEAALAL
jgi:hypothetical protein